MTSNDRFSFSVTNGPSKFDLMLSLFDGNKEPRRTVEFHLDGARAPITVGISGVQQEDGSGESWIFEGNLTNYRRHFDVRGYYSSNSRKGHITFIAPFHYELNGDDRTKVEQPEDQHALADYLNWLRGKGSGWPIPDAREYAKRS